MLLCSIWEWVVVFFYFLGDIVGHGYVYISIFVNRGFCNTSYLSNQLRFRHISLRWLWCVVHFPNLPILIQNHQQRVRMVLACQNVSKVLGWGYFVVTIVCQFFFQSFFANIPAWGRPYMPFLISVYVNPF